MDDNSVVFTSAAILDFLSKIEELSEYDIDVTETPNSIEISIGDSTYNIDTSAAVDIPVEDEVVDAVEDVNDEAYEDLDADGVDVNIYEEGEPVESGVLKELAKSLLLGGMIRLSKKLL